MAVLNHVLNLYLCLSSIVLTVYSSPSALPSITCSVQTSTGASLSCTSKALFKRDCRRDNKHVNGKTLAKRSIEEMRQDIIIDDRPLNSVNSWLDLKFPLWDIGRASVIIQEQPLQPTLDPAYRCVAILVTSTHKGQVTLQNLALPHGSYEVKLIQRRGGGGGGGEEGGEEGGGRKERGGVEDMIVSRHRFALPTSTRGREPSRQRRHSRRTAVNPSRSKLSTGDLVLQNFNHKETYKCPCCNCLNYTMRYVEDQARLIFSYVLKDSCDTDCSAVNVQLYRDNEIKSKEECDTVKLQSVPQERIQRDQNVTEGSIKFEYVDTGCYFIETRTIIYRVPERTSTLWATPSIPVPDMDEWDTVFNLEPNPDRRTLIVSWLETQPYNFSSYELEMYHDPSVPIKCTGKEIYPNMSIVYPGPVRVQKPTYTFHNLSSGWYCARVTPKDNHCPTDGCHVIASRPEQLTEPVKWDCGGGGGGGDDEGCGEGSVLGFTLIVVGCIVGAIVTGVMIAWGILHTWPSIIQMFNSATYYSPVLPMRDANKRDERIQKVLLVWTPQGPNGAEFLPIIKAFKTILRTYSHCQVYDYLDLASLPRKQQRYLLSSPTTWLEYILEAKHIKIIIVATEGAWQRQVEWMQTDSTIHQQDNTHTLYAGLNNAYDNLLFPYLLRRLQDQPELAGDYSRLFHVRFSDVSHSNVELGNVVSWKRYKIPEHLKSLTASLHGDTGTAGLEEPSDDVLQELHTALCNHPQHTNGTQSPWITPVTLSNGTTKTCV